VKTLAILDEVLKYYDEIAARAPTDDIEYDFVMTASEYKFIRQRMYEQDETIESLKSALADCEAKCAQHAAAIEVWQREAQSAQAEVERLQRGEAIFVVSTNKAPE
jgi:chromosome segregation ATPase